MKQSRFVQFGPDQECHCGAICCRKKLGVKPKKPKLDSDEETLNLVISEVAQTSTLPQVFFEYLSEKKHQIQTYFFPHFGQVHQNEAILEGKYGFLFLLYLRENLSVFWFVSNLVSIVSPGTLINKVTNEGQTCPRNCIGVVIRLSRPTSDRYLYFLLDSWISFLVHAIIFF